MNRFTFITYNNSLITVLSLVAHHPGVGSASARKLWIVGVTHKKEHRENREHREKGV